MIYCPKCAIDKEDSEFGNNKRRKNGKQSWCKSCTIEYNKKWYSENKKDHISYVASHKKRKTHTCNNCGKSEPEVTFYQKRDSQSSRPRFLCVECSKEYRKKYPTRTDSRKRGNKKKAAKEKVERTDPTQRAKYIMRDSRTSDIKKGLDNDLDIGFVNLLISNPCSYCGTTQERMTLDRIDNSLGHSKSNVIPACIQCNFFRRDMPYEAWMLLVPGMKRARESGLLNGWNSGTHKARERLPDEKALSELSEL